MKKIYLLLTLFSIFSCSESNNLKPVDFSGKPILGVWKLTETYISPGGETTWQPAENEMVYNLHSDGTFDLTGGECSSGTFEMADDKIHFHCSNSGDTRSYYINKLTETTLEISYIGCIEACIYRFKKQ